MTLTGNAPCRVLIVDDSAVVRQMLTESCPAIRPSTWSAPLPTHCWRARRSSAWPRT